MSGRIPRQFIDDLLLRVDIVDLVDSRVPLKKSGNNFVARCPFHTEKTPSFSVNRNRQTYHCFGCGAGGNAIGFLMDYAHLGFVEAIEDLAGFIGIDVPRELEFNHDAKPVVDSAGIFQTLEAVAVFYAEQLRSEAGQKAVAYLKQRGVSGLMAKTYGLGYAPLQWDALLGRFDRQKLLDAGLAVQKDDGKIYDRFRDRLMFPIRDKRHRVIGFGGRVLDDSLPKYLNSPETAVFLKGKEVYGLSELLDADSKPLKILMVEGYMDVIALAQYGLRYSVAALGTATSKSHMDMLFRFTSEIVFCFDGDRAGQQAAWKAVEAALPSLRDGRQVKIMLLPQGHDPDSLVRDEGLNGFEERIQNAQSLSDYFFEHLSENIDLDVAEGRAKLLASAKPHLEKIPAGFFRDIMLGRLQALAGNHFKPKNLAQDFKKTKRPQSKGSSLMRKLLALLLQYPQFAKLLDPVIFELNDDLVPGIGFLQQVARVIAEEKPENSAILLEFFRGSEFEKTVNTLLNMDWAIAQMDAEGEFHGAMQQLIRQADDARMSFLIDKLANGGVLSEQELQDFKKGGRSNRG